MCIILNLSICNSYKVSPYNLSCVSELCTLCQRITYIALAFLSGMICPFLVIRMLYIIHSGDLDRGQSHYSTRHRHKGCVDYT